MCEAIADHIPLLAKGEDSHFQSKVHLAMTAKGFNGSDAPDDKKD